MQACASLEPNYQPPVTFVVVQKRHHTRLFANNHKDRTSTDKSGNILPGWLIYIFTWYHLNCLFMLLINSSINPTGTVVDSKICHPSEFDFFLCSHAGIQVGFSFPSFNFSTITHRRSCNFFLSFTGNQSAGALPCIVGRE